MKNTEEIQSWNRKILVHVLHGMELEKWFSSYSAARFPYR